MHRIFLNEDDRRGENLINYSPDLWDYSYNNESRSEQDLKKKNRIKEKPGRKEEMWLTKGILIDKELYNVEEMDNINTI